jgi:UDP-3-O-[3-hydroxymyristoyl] glucosamine N-acyltransferase
MKNIIKLSRELFVSDILREINLSAQYIGSKKIKFNNISSYKNSNSQSLIFLTKKIFEKELNNNLSKVKSKIIILNFLEKKIRNKNLIVTKYPHHYISKIIQYLNSVSLIKENNFMSNSNYVSRNIQVGKNVKIGKNVNIYPNVYLDNCVIGDNVTIGPNTSIGYKGLVRYKYKNMNLNFTSAGKVIIKNNVEIGANCIIARGTIEHTIINNDIIIANNINIGHNCKINTLSEISSGSKIGGGVVIKKNCFLALGCKINPNIVVEENNFVGAGSVVTKNTLKNSKLFGSPAKRIASLKK